jgi:hypothetical protein
MSVRRMKRRRGSCGIDSRVVEEDCFLFFRVVVGDGGGGGGGEEIVVVMVVLVLEAEALCGCVSE